MGHPHDKLTDAIFTQAPMGLVWMQTTDKDQFGGGDFSAEYDCWMLIDRATDRMLVSIDGPYPDKICYVVAAERGAQRRYISLEGAKRYAVAIALGILHEEHVERARVRKVRRMEKVSR